MGLHKWFNKMFGGSGEATEHDSEPPVDIDAIKADTESARIAGEASPAAAERMSDPDAS
jgi:hypothetical protein